MTQIIIGFKKIMLGLIEVVDWDTFEAHSFNNNNNNNNNNTNTNNNNCYYYFYIFMHNSFS